MWRWTSGETRANVLRETASLRTLSPLIRTPIWTVFHARAAFQELSQLPQLHPDRVLMRRRDAGVEADAREWADLAFGVAKNPSASLYLGQVFRAPKPPGCFQVLIKPSLPLGNPPASARASP